MGDPVKSTLTAKQQSDLDILMAKATERGFSEEQKTKARAKYLEGLGLAESIRAKNIADTQEQERQYPKVDKTFEQEARKRLRDSGIDPNANPAEYRDSFGKVYDQVAAEHEAKARNVVKKKSPFGEDSLPGLGTDSKSTPEEVADWPELETLPFPSTSPAQDPSAKKSIDMQLEYSKMMEEQAAKLAAEEEAMSNIRDMLSGTSGVRSDVSDPYMGAGSQKLEVSQRGLRDKMNFISDKEKSFESVSKNLSVLGSKVEGLRQKYESAIDLHTKKFEPYWNEEQGGYVFPEGNEKILSDFNESVAALTELEGIFGGVYDDFEANYAFYEESRNDLNKIYSEIAKEANTPEEIGFWQAWATNTANRAGSMLGGVYEFGARWMPNVLDVNPVSFLLSDEDSDELLKKMAPTALMSGKQRIEKEKAIRERSVKFAESIIRPTGAFLQQKNVLNPKRQAALQRYMDENFVAASFISVASPEMATAFIPYVGPAVMTAAFASSSYYDAQRELDKAIGNIDPNDTESLNRAYNIGEAYAVTLSATTAVLEKFGFSLVMNPLTKRVIASRVLAKLPSLGNKVGKRALERLILAESSTLSRVLANKAITAVAGSFEEGVTEGLQELNNEGLKRIFNSAADLNIDLFEEGTAEEIFENTWKSFAMGTVGGAFMHGVSQIFSGDPNSLSKEEYAGAIAYLRKLPNLDGVKRAMLQGPAVPGGVVDDRFKDMTPQELEDAYQKVKGYWEAAKSLPDDMDNYTAAVAIGLVQQKQSLQKRMAKPGLDPAFIKKMEEKIGEIDAQLGKLFEEGVKPEDRVGVDEPTLTPKEKEGKKDEGKDTLSGWLGKMSEKAEGKAEPEKKTFSEWVSEMSKKEEESPSDPDSEPMGFAGALQKLVEAADKGKEEKTFGEWLETLAPKAKEDAAAQEGAKEPFSSALSRLTEGKKEKDTPTGFSGILQKMFGQKVEDSKGKAQKETLGDALSRLSKDPNAEKMTLSQWLGQMTTANPKEKKSFGEMLQEISPVEQVSALMEVEVEPGVSFGSLLSQLGKEQVPQGPMTLGDFLGALQPTKKPQPRKPTAPKGSYAASEVDRVKALDEASEDGATFNQDGSKYDKGGLVIPLASKNMSQEELTPEAIDAFIEENAGKVGSDKVKVGIYKFPNSNQVSIDLNIVAGRAIREQAIAIGKELGQESLFDLDSFENIKTGADGKNPKQLTDQEFVELQKRIEGLEAEAESKTKTDANETKPKPGNRLFNEPLQEVKRIADEYFARVFGKERPRYTGSKKLDTNRAKRISDAFQAMKNDPNNPRVKAAYEALAKETLDQYQAFLDAGYKVEINNSEPYANSKEMIDDLRDRKVIKIFSTESGFGDTPITDQQRAENPLLRDSGFSDMNGNPMLINDAFRAIHDFYGHAELGNSFGPKGEENAWNVHARMFSPLARAAMTTETRGQNSFVNFSGVNEEIEKMRDEARKLREQGDEAGAQAIVEQIYEKMSFADQKVGLLPDEFHQIDETDTGDVDVETQQEAEAKTDQQEAEAKTDSGKEKESKDVTNKRQVQETTKNKTREQAEQEAEDFLRNSEDADARRLSGAIDRVRKSLEKVTGARVTVLRAADFKKYTGRDARVGGVFKIINGRPVIIINADSASFRVPYHELAHYVLRSAIGSNPKAFASAKADLIRAIRKDFPKEVAQEIISKLDEFADRYAYDQDGNKIPPNQIPDDVRAKMDEEWMVEFMAFMADSGPQSWSTRDFNFRKKGFLEKVADIISKFLNAVGIDLKLYDTKATDMAEFVTVFANAASRGDNVVDVINLWKGPKPSGLFSNMTLESRNENYMSLSSEERTKATKAAVKKGRSASTLSPENPSMEGFDYDAYKADIDYASKVSAIMLDKQLNVAPKKRQEIEEAVEKLINANASPERIAKVRKRMEVENSGYIPGLAGIKLVPEPRPVSKSILEFGDRKAISEAKKRYEKRKAKVKELNAKKLDEINDRIKGNLLFLYEKVGDRVREVSKLWYDGANIMAQDMGKEYGISHEQAAAAIAVCSPRTDWFQNMAIADHVVKFLTKESSKVIDADIVKGMKKGGEKGWYPKWTGKGKLEGKTFAEAIEMVKAGEVPVNAVSHVLHYMGNSQLIPSYITSPDGIVMGPAVTAAGKNKKTGFKEGAAIEKAVSIVLDGSPENVSKQLGGGHKVRNFYVNIIDPTVKHAVTIDTHAVAAAWLFPYSSKAKVVSAIFGASGMGKNTKHDTSSYYWVYARAYTELANELGILPRELQSITWEAARSMFTEVTAKKSGSFIPILEIYEAVDRGDLSIEEARQEIFDVAPGTNNGSLDKYNWEGQFFANDDAAESRGSAMFDFSGRNKKHPGVARAKASGIIPDNRYANTADAASLFLESEMELRKKPLRERISKKLFDRQAHVRAALNRANAAIVEAKMVNSFGAAANAKQNFVRAHSKIYGGLSHDLNEALNTIIYLRRVIDVDATHDSKGKQRPKHPPFQDPNSTASIPMNKELAQQMLDQLNQDLGTDFFDLDNRANAYFDEFRKILGRKLEFGLITQEEFDRFVNNDYEPRLFVDKMLDQADNALLQGSAGMAGTSISDSQFNVIKNGSEMPLIKDSEWLLQNAWSSVERTGMRNRFFASLSELIGNPSVVADRNWVKAANTEMVYVRQPGQGVSVPGQSTSVPTTTQTAGSGTRATRVIKTDNFGNHIISKADTGYVNVYYRENGQLRAVQVRKEYAAEIVNPNAGTEASAIWRKVAKLTGVGILKPIATGMNALFPIANIPMDYMNVLMFTDAYDGNAFLGKSAFELFRDFSKNFAGLQVNDPQIMFDLEEALSYGMGMDFLSDQGRDFIDYTKRSGLDKLREKAGIGDRRSAATKAIEREELMVKIAGLGIAGDVSKNSELAMRMAVYQKVKAKALRQGMSPDEAKTYAASKARKTMDFSQGSAGAKVGDQFVAYLNAGLQAFRVAGSYISSNPKKFAGKMAQMGVASVIMSFMMHALMDDDEINEIPDYEFQRYFIIPTFGAIKNDEGNKGYFRIRINPQVAAFINPFRMIGRSLAKTAKGQEVDWRQEMAEYSLAIESGVPVVGGALSTMYKSMFEKGTNSSVFTDVMTQVMPPSVAAILAYWGNYDSFRDKAISTEKGDVPVEVEGLYDNRVHDTYKVAAKSMGLSPERLQVSAGKVLTDTHTNFAIAVSFALSDQVLGKLLLEEDERSGSQEIWSKAGRRVIRYGNPEWRKYKKSDEAKAFEQEENAIRYRIRENIKTMVRRDATDREIIDYVNKLDLGQEDKNYVVKYVESSRAVRNIDHPMKYELITMSYIRDPEAQAKYFYHEFGVVDNPDDVNEFRDILSKATGKKWNFSERFLNEYERLIEENKEKYK